MTHIYVTITSTKMLIYGPIDSYRQTFVGDIQIKTHKLSVKKKHLKMSSVRYRPLCSSLVKSKSITVHMESQVFDPYVWVTRVYPAGFMLFYGSIASWPFVCLYMIFGAPYGPFIGEIELATADKSQLSRYHNNSVWTNPRKIINVCINLWLWYIKAETKWLPFYKWRFYIYLIGWKSRNLIQLHGNLYLMIQLTKNRIVLLMAWRQINEDIVRWHYSAFGLVGLRQTF